ncbi:MAG: hypothetical protein J5634_03625 [Bacilli bacterium]|nr:hypothetical protein [Bacilli bacterium]
MKEKINKIIYVFDDNLDSVISFEASQKGLYDLLLKYNFAIVSYELLKDKKSYINLVYLTELYNKIFDEFDFTLEIKNNNELMKFYKNVKELSSNFYQHMSNNKSTLDKLISYYKLTINGYSYSIEYEFDNVEDYKKINNIETLTMNRVMGGISTIDLSDLDDEPTDEEIEEYMKDPDCNLESELILDTIYCYPIHEDFFHYLDEQLRLETKAEDLLNLVIYTEEYLHQFKDKQISDNYKKDYDNLNKTLNSKRNLLKKVKTNYNIYYHNIKSELSFSIEAIQTMYNNKVVFINKIFSTFINKGDLNFFRELKALFNEFNIKDVDDCINLVKQFSDMLEENKMDNELICLKNLIKNGNVTKFISDLYNGFDKVTKSFIFNQKFERYLDDGKDGQERK